MEGRRLSLSHLLPAMWAGRPAHPWERELSYCPDHPAGADGWELTENNAGQRRPGDLRTTGTCAAQPGPH